MLPNKRARASEDGSISLTFQDAAARVAKPPVGWDDVLEEDKQDVLRIMVQFTKEIEPNNQKKKWSVRPICGTGGVVTSYAAAFAGYTGVIRSDALESFRHKYASHVSYIGIDLSFVTADRAHTGAIVLCILSQATIGQTVQRYEEAHGAAMPAHHGAFDAIGATPVPAPSIVPTLVSAAPTAAALQPAPPVVVGPVHQMAGIPAERALGHVATVTSSATATGVATPVRGEQGPGTTDGDAQYATSTSKRTRGFWGTIASIAGLGDGTDSGDER